MIIATIRMSIPPSKSAEALKILRLITELCRDDPGCNCCHIYADLEEKNDLILEEVWRARENLDLHLRSDEFHNLLVAMEMALKEPEIRFNTISSSAGMEIVEMARNQAR